MIDMIIGNIIQVKNIDTYVLKIPTDSIEYALGRFVKIEKGDRAIIGVISEITHSIKEEMLPYIPPDKQPKYIPYYEDYRDSNYIIHGIGVMYKDRVVYKVTIAPHVRDVVKLLSNEEIRRFHTINGKQSAAYLYEHRNRLEKHVRLNMVDQLLYCLPESRNMLYLIRRHIEKEEL
ncbi:MAG: hypothetical protein ACE5J9_04905 [Methanosarcinales archaeon]